jgi:hypothetical protein
MLERIKKKELETKRTQLIAERIDQEADEANFVEVVATASSKNEKMTRDKWLENWNVDSNDSCTEDVDQHEDPLNETAADEDDDAFEELINRLNTDIGTLNENEVIDLEQELLDAYIPCGAHNVQLVVNDGMKLSDEYTALIKRVSKQIVSKSKFSSYIAEELRKIDKKLIQRNATRWSSILAMIRALLRLTEKQLNDIRLTLPEKTAKQRQVKDNFRLKVNAIYFLLTTNNDKIFIIFKNKYCLG